MILMVSFSMVLQKTTAKMVLQPVEKLLKQAGAGPCWELGVLELSDFGVQGLGDLVSKKENSEAGFGS